ncbi:YT521-B-like domain-containing protein [Endogone sp. FLAS-F59071]|nr:YT521-B-like domain-containing protein [Endogone sp. FLAS-F59071]|eukprot:RUS15309.1 YT521-B-like domain-containing protein [Endogone sp. FLAS-F59071]
MTSPIIPNRAADPTASVQWTPVPVDDEDEEDDEDDEDAEQQNGEASQQQHRRQSDSEAEAEATAAAAAAAVTAAATAAAAAAAAAAMAAESEKEEKEKEEKGKEEREHNGERRGSGSGNGNGNMKKDQATKERREKRWGNVFKVEWVKVQRLPFSQTRHLRNPWNNNREVKVSRDGTELETRVGERLLLEFWRAEQAVVGGAVLQGQQPTAQSQQSVGVQPSQQPQPQPQPSPQPPAAQAQMVMGLGLINTPQGLQAVPMPMMQPTVMVGMWGTSPRPGYMAVPPGGMGQGPNNG